MIPKRILKKRAAHGYAWLKKNGLTFNLDVNQLHRKVWELDVQAYFACPLALADIEGENPQSHRTHFGQISDRLAIPHREPGTSTVRRVVDVPQFLTDGGFHILKDQSFLKMLFAWGSDRDWEALTEAWRQVIAANRPAEVPQEQTWR